MKKYLIFAITFLLSMFAFSQNVLNSKSPEELRTLREKKKDIKLKLVTNQDGTLGYTKDSVSTLNTPLSYGFIEDKDILWSKVTWEIIDFKERLNQVFYHTSDGIVSANLSLFQALKKGMEDGKIKEVYVDEFFTEKRKASDVISATSNTIFNSDYLDEILNNGGTPTHEDSLAATVKYNVGNTDVRLMKIKGLWYVDKRLGEMKFRVLGIAMMGPDPQTIGRKDIVGGDEMIDMFWIWYDDARDVLSNYQVFNPNNNSSPITYDDLLNARRFNSIIYRSDSEFSDGVIDSYLPKDAKAQLEESNRIKNAILEHENEMWNY